MRVFAPATIGNVAAGFDVMGLAVRPETGAPWGDEVEVRPGAGPVPRLSVDGPYADKVPQRAEDNLVFRVHGLFRDHLARRGRAADAVDLHLHKGLPVGSGLGSSSASIVAALVALNEAHGRPFTSAELVPIAGEAEAIFSGGAHLDNVGPALLGGLQVIHADGSCGALPVPEAWRFVLLHPDIVVRTEEARAILPRTVPLHDAVAYWQNLASFVWALGAGQGDRALTWLKDELVEPHRRGLVPRFAETRQAALAAGARAFSLSGSGPSMFAVTPTPADASAVCQAMVAAWAGSGIAVKAAVCVVDQPGARLVSG